MEKKYAIMLGSLSAALPAAANTDAGLKPKDKTPNIVVFLVDDMGWMDSSCYGSSFYRTPNIDALASVGRRYTDAYSACTVSSPTRAALMTGKYPARLHLTDFIAGHDFAWEKLSPPQWTKFLPTEEVTVAETLKEAGYQTWHMGKWHLGNEEQYFPQYQGFDINIAGCGAGAPGSVGVKYHGYFTPYNIKYNLLPGVDDEYLTDRLTDEAVALIKRHGDKPFYLNMAHYAVHMPIQGKKEKIEKYKTLVDSTYFQKNPTYAAMIESMDESLGRIVETLKEEGLLENTLIIFTSDNGAVQSISGCNPLRSGKGSEYEGGVRVPLIISWPGRIKPATVSHEQVITMDIAATLMDIAGSDQTGNIDGISLVPSFGGKNVAERPLFWHYPHYHTAKPYSSVRYGRWKLIEHLEDGALELYDLRKDIGESKNLAAKNTKKAAELHTLLNDWRQSVGAQMPVANPEYDAAKVGKKRQKTVNNDPMSFKIDFAKEYSEVYRHNPDLRIYFLFPDKVESGKIYPTAVFYFGGGWTGGDVQAFATQGRELADKGMIVALVDYRIKKKHGTTPMDCVGDAKSAMRYLKKNAQRLHIDTTRIVASGGSAGGHLAAATALVDGFDLPGDDLSISSAPTALALFNPVFNNAPEPEGYGYERIKEFFPQFSPFHNIKAGAPPTLIMLGTKDHLVPVSVAEEYVNRMHKVGSRCELELYDGAGHGFFNYNRKKGDVYYRQTLDRMIEFLKSLNFIE